MDQVNQNEFKPFLEKTVKKLAWVTRNNHQGMPYYVLPNGKYKNMDTTFSKETDGDVSWWTNGFFGGILWQLYTYTKEDKYKEWARIQEVKLDRCFDIFEGINHDVGFMWLHTSVANYKMTKDPKSKIRALHAANILAGRYNPKGHFIRAWGTVDDMCTGWAIIDCLMNLSLLYWATEETGDPRYELIAREHADMAMKEFIREDGSSHHIVKFDPRSGEVVSTDRGQGYSAEGSWTRGQAWAIYGFSNSYTHTKEESYLKTAKKVADYFIEQMPDSNLCPIDFTQPEGDDKEDNSAACIAICGLLELGQGLEAIGEDGQFYIQKAEDMLRVVCNERLCLDESSEALVEKCAVAYHFDKHVDTLIYADYFLVEALLKVQNLELKMW
ncbi:glycoside hydrolase family 88 protein [Marinilactibacillus kalidii]|uniref:glycoside hydrolase family 88 protein n=1 Tax=Marinilactibacillus kalidii TaxID=2820274 RepID=UPI001ABDDD5B|nr:glycoside hydrolase family 88 protein [Marinilactibacillus kalidii]